MDIVNWEKLKEYDNDKRKSFELLSYCIAKLKYGSQGIFTPVDDSGGGDGVEFYLTTANGVWGWQAKFFHPDCRLSISNRKAQIQNSLKKACKVHSDLKKWYLCIPGDFTPEEDVWFKQTLPKAIPEGMEVELIPWNDSDYNSFLTDPAMQGVLGYFFGEKVIDLEWCRAIFEKEKSNLRGKYKSILHVETDVEDCVLQCIDHNVLNKIVSDSIKICDEKYFYQHDITNSLKTFINSLNKQLEEKFVSDDIFTRLDELNNQGKENIGIVNEIRENISFNKFDKTDLNHLSETIKKYIGNINSLNDHLRNILHNLEILINKKTIILNNDLRKIYNDIDNYGRNFTYAHREIHDELENIYNFCLDILEAFLYVEGAAGYGKTHVACSIIEKLLDTDKPAILILGRHITNNNPLTKQILGVLGLSESISWLEFCKILNVAALVHEVRIPLIIDGLNEATENGSFTTVWKRELLGLIQDFKSYPNLILIVTYRKSYGNAIWESIDQKEDFIGIGLPGFDNYNINIAVEKYFEYYKIRANLIEDALKYFRFPLYLRIFCEVKNRVREDYVQVRIGQESIFEILQEYLNQMSKTIAESLGFRASSTILDTCLEKISQKMWSDNRRSITLDELQELIDGQESKWIDSKTKKLIDEDLLVYRDWQEDAEVVSFTYDLLAGYIISKNLIKLNLKDFFADPKNINKLFSENYQDLHPLAEDISRSLACLLPVKTGLFLHDYTSNRYAKKRSIASLFELPQDCINDSAIQFAIEEFSNKDTRHNLLYEIDYIAFIPNHPLNFKFWNTLIAKLDMADRDIFWTEHIRRRATSLIDKMLFIEDQLVGNTTVDDEELHLHALYFMWCLTSTSKPLRDHATKALYYYGRKFPEKFFDLLSYSLTLDDPYISERTLAAGYGVCMALQFDSQNNFTKTHLKEIALTLYEQIFSEDAKYSTTHILARYYAKGILEIALLHYPKMLNKQQKIKVCPPYSHGGIRDWGESDEVDKNDYQKGMSPIQMDFDNYTMGGLTRGRRNYDFDNNQHKLNKARIFWRIYQLGYSKDIFGQVDSEIAQRNFASNDNKKVDRYGKKYSWIAYYELAGYLADVDWDNKKEDYERDHLSEVDIDPSFPKNVEEFHYIKDDILNVVESDFTTWIQSENSFDIKPYKLCQDLAGREGEWFMLKGYCTGQDGAVNRNAWDITVSVIIKNKKVDEFLELLKHYEEGFYDFNPVNANYIFAGEIPWVKQYMTGFNEVHKTIGFKSTLYSEEEYKLFRGDNLIDTKERLVFLKKLDKPNSKKNGISIYRFDLRRHNPKKGVFYKYSDKEKLKLERLAKKEGLTIKFHRELKENKTYKWKEFKVLNPVINYSWESYHSVLNDAGHPPLLGAEVAKKLKLSNKPQIFNLYDKLDNEATLNFAYGNLWTNGQEFLFIRKDLIDQYLKNTDSTLFSLTWGEKSYYTEDSNERMARNTQYSKYKSVEVYEPDNNSLRELNLSYTTDQRLD